MSDTAAKPTEPFPFAESAILYRFTSERNDDYDIAEEYAVVAIDVPPGVMLWARVEDRWVANPWSAREPLRHLLGAARNDRRRIRKELLAAIEDGTHYVEWKEGEANGRPVDEPFILAAEIREALDGICPPERPSHLPPLSKR